MNRYHSAIRPNHKRRNPAASFLCVFALVMVLGPLLLVAQNRSCDLTIYPSDWEINGHENAAGIGPGDTICLAPGSRSFIWIRFIHGSPGNPVVIINTTGGVDMSDFYYGIKIDSCSHIKLSGKGVPYINYGIRVHDISGGGVSIEGLSTDIEIEGLEISGTVFVGIFAKSDPDCDFKSTRDKYVLRNLSIHDNYIHHVGMEGFYIGSSFYAGKTIHCNGKDTLVYPHVLKGVLVYNNIIEHAGWDGIQVASSDSGCAIFNNLIVYDSDSAEYNQMSGILIGGGSNCDCYNNTIKDGKGVGINVFGLGGQRIYNNLIVRAGRTFPDDYPMMSGIYVGDEVTLPGTGYVMAYNTIISPKVFGIHYGNMQTSGSIAANNIIMDPGRTYYDGVNFQAINNLTSMQMQPDQFVDPVHDNYDLKATSPAVNGAIELTQLPLATDILYRSRPFAKDNDIGAFECHDSSLLSVNHPALPPSPEFGLLPSDNGNTVTLQFTLFTASSVQISLFTLTGERLSILSEGRFPPGKHKKEVDIRNLSSGIYVFHFVSGTDSLAIKYQLFR